MTTALRADRIMTPTGAEGFPEPLHTELTRHGETIVVVAFGEIDLTSADRLLAQLRGLLSSVKQVVLDLREVVFIDSAALHCMLEVDRASRDAGVEFLLVPGPQQVQRLFQVTRTEDALRFIEPSRIDRRRM
jgi:anti-anti-sigma factor